MDEESDTQQIQHNSDTTEILSGEANPTVPTGSISPITQHSPTEPEQIETCKGPDVAEQPSRANQLELKDIQKDVHSTAVPLVANLENRSLGQETNFLPRTSQEFSLMSVQASHASVVGESIEEDNAKEAAVVVNGSVAQSSTLSFLDETAATVDKPASSRDVDNKNISDIIPCDSKKGETVEQTAITSLELAAAATEETFPRISPGNIMTSSTALCKYRWAKVVSTDSADVGFYPSYAPTEPILLSWDAAFKAYLSPELRIDCGSYHGVLKVDGNALHVEDFVVKSYTFEVDLFIKEDILEAKCPSPPTLEFRSSPSNAGCAAPIPTTSTNQAAASDPNTSEAAKILEKVMPYLNPKDGTDLTPTRESTANLVDDLDRKSPLTNSGVGNSLPTSILKTSSPLQSLPVRRASPIGDDKSGESVKVGSEYSDTNGISLDRAFSSGISQEFGRDKATSHELQSHSKISSTFVYDIIGGAGGKRTDGDVQPVRLADRESSRLDDPGVLSTFKGQEKGDNLTYISRSTPPNLPAREERILSQSPTKDKKDQFNRPTDGIYGRPLPQPSRDRDEEEHLGFISQSGGSDRQYQEHEKRSIESSSSRDRHRDVDSEDSSKIRERQHKRDMEDPYSHRGSLPPSIPTHNKDGRYGRADTDARSRSRGSREGSYTGSQHSSRANSHSSLTSEQELGQYWDSEPRSHSEVQRERWQRDEDVSARSGRLERPASVPSYGTRSENATDKRSSTPDNRVRVPTTSWSRSDRNTLNTDRFDDGLGGRASVASSDGRRTITPGLGNREVDTEDLRNKVDHLRQLVSRRDSEISSLRDELQDIKHDRSSRQRDSRSGHSSAERVQNSLEYKQLQSEKEILATEVTSLREEVHRLTGRHHSGGRTSDSGGRTSSSAISDYSPHSPLVLQRKIADLESQIHDLQEVNEATTSSLSRTEEKVRLLQEENHDLRSRVGNNLEDSGDQHSLRVQMRTLREDITSLRERNFQLTEENMRLQDPQGSRSTLATASLAMPRSRSNAELKSEDNQTSRSMASTEVPSSVYGSRYPTTNSTGVDSSKQYQSFTSRSSREDLAPKDYRNRGSSLGRVHNPDSQSSSADVTSSKYLHHRNAQQYSPRLRFSSSGSDVISHKPPNASSLTSRSGTSTSVADRDRSRPDGEVSEHVHTDRYRPVIRSSYESLQQDRNTKSSTKDSNSHKSASYSFSKDRSGGFSKDGHSDFRREDTYLNYLSDSKLDRPNSSRQPRPSSKGNSVGSKDIFMNLKKKLASQWLQQENRYISGNLDLDRYQSSSARDKVEDDADDSDTATDILLAQDTGTAQASFRSGKSLGSDGGLSSDEAAEDIDSSGHLGGTSTSTLRRRCRSADPGTNARQSDTWRETSTRTSRNFQPPSSSSALQRSEKTRSGSPFSSRRETSSLRASSGEDREDMRSVSSAGHRSVLPTPLVTQHNKHELAKSSASLLNSTLTRGLRPFAPRSPADIRIDDVVKFSRLGGKLTQGCVKYVGHLPGRSEVYLGVELDRDEGKHDGTFEDIRYFKCKSNKGVFVAFNKIVMAWAP